MVALLPLAAGSFSANSRTAFSRAVASSGVRARTSFTTSSRPGTESVPPPPGPWPETRSGTTAMKPSRARWSATARIQSERPKTSWMTMTTPALPLRSG